MSCIQTLGVTSTLCLYCYAMLVDVDWFERTHERCERLLLTITEGGYFNTHLGGLVGAPCGLPGHLENPVLAQGDPGVPV